MLLLIFAVGMLLSGVTEAHIAGDQVWVFVFTAGLISTVILYFRVVADMLRWLEGYNPVYTNVCNDVCCRDGDQQWDDVDSRQD